MIRSGSDSAQLVLEKVKKDEPPYMKFLKRGVWPFGHGRSRPYLGHMRACMLHVAMLPHTNAHVPIRTFGVAIGPCYDLPKARWSRRIRSRCAHLSVCVCLWLLADCLLSDIWCPGGGCAGGRADGRRWICWFAVCATGSDCAYAPRTWVPSEKGGAIVVAHGHVRPWRPTVWSWPGSRFAIQGLMFF